MSLAEIEKAVDELGPDELTKLSAYIARRDDLQWDQAIDEDFSASGRLRAVLEEVRADMRGGRLQDLP